MSKLFSQTSIIQFFNQIYYLLKSSIDNKSGWFEISQVKFLQKLNKDELKEFLENFEFIDIKKGNYDLKYLLINKILFVMESIRILNLDLKVVSELLDYSEFELLINKILLKNNYKALNNFRFSDKSNFKTKTAQKRYEIDVIGINKKHVLLIDAKHWKRKDSYSSINKAADLQIQRAIALMKNPEIFSKLIQDLLGLNINLKNYLPFKLIPIMVTLEDNGNKLNDNQVPLVSIYFLNAFLQEVNFIPQFYKTIMIKKINIQKRLY